MDMALRRPLRPREREPGLHSVIVFFERLRKAAQFGDALLFDLFQPCIKAFPFPLTQHGRKLLDEFVGLADLLIRFAELAEVLLLPLQALIFLKGNPMSDLESGWGTFGWRWHRRFLGRINRLEFPVIFLCAKLNKIALNGLV